MLRGGAQTGEVHGGQAVQLDGPVQTAQPPLVLILQVRPVTPVRHSQRQHVEWTTTTTVLLPAAATVDLVAGAFQESIGDVKFALQEGIFGAAYPHAIHEHFYG